LPSVLWCCWLGLLTCKTVSRITYTVLVETLNPAQSNPIKSNCSQAMYLWVFYLYNYCYYYLVFSFVIFSVTNWPYNLVTHVTMFLYRVLPPVYCSFLYITCEKLRIIDKWWWWGFEVLAFDIYPVNPIFWRWRFCQYRAGLYPVIFTHSAFHNHLALSILSFASSCRVHRKSKYLRVLMCSVQH